MPVGETRSFVMETQGRISLGEPISSGILGIPLVATPDCRRFFQPILSVIGPHKEDSACI